ncbi:MAG: C39 family peptidase [Candidatus Sericytochromatia bacterium]|nr:C39 family peptidase [Candidatus Sericytochromatia bacterium]
MRRTSAFAWGSLVALLMFFSCSSSPLEASVWLARRVAAPGGDSAAEAGSPELVAALQRADHFFISQYRHARWNPTELRQTNANCGPTSLAMALCAYGVRPGQAEAPDQAALIRRVRRAMTGMVEEGVWTYPIEIAAGARVFGLHAEFIHGLDAIRQAMREPGRLVILNLNPSPAYVARLTRRYDGGHFALLTAIEGDRATLCDPLAPGPMVVTLAQLGQALTTPLGHHADGRVIPPFNGGVLVWP